MLPFDLLLPRAYASALTYPLQETSPKSVRNNHRLRKPHVLRLRLYRRVYELHSWRQSMTAGSSSPTTRGLDEPQFFRRDGARNHVAAGAPLAPDTGLRR